MNESQACSHPYERNKLPHSQLHTSSAKAGGGERLCPPQDPHHAAGCPPRPQPTKATFDVHLSRLSWQLGGRRMAAEIRCILGEISPTEALCPGSWKEIIASLIFLATSVHTPKADLAVPGPCGSGPGARDQI